MRKNKILQESLALFANKGYFETSMEDIAKAVGIKKASLYSHFSGKEDIFSAVFNHILIDYSTFINELTTFKENVDVQEKLNIIFTRYIKNCRNNAQMDFWDRYFYYPPEYLKEYIHEKTDETEKELTKKVAAIIEEGIEKKQFKNKDASEVALAYYYMMIGFAMSIKFYDERDIERDLSSCFNAFLDGIKI
ncbi:TetR/AcrR family transcriptional regulator [Chengkuizengella axinellae]|uniref:TetR/AcrR family transcriptional regulator n=1 Tax=Chengkuizengella axinellae TaxID=3064388 RepID=A0ABT9IZM6_9BACL|nr:TetR/AcrR family transcriptional regulator [Chengkuizengella sp. 2205SS18-9]MDP5274826.1 TetR/AcrR family transcriptional regulator [Chengkuizengella sp. 2205SS18-9]